MQMASGQSVILWGLFENIYQSNTGRLSNIKFEVYGCPAAIATTSVLTEIAIGKTLEEALEITDLDIARALGGLPDPKMHCSNLGAGALSFAIKDYCSRNGHKTPADPDSAGS